MSASAIAVKIAASFAKSDKGKKIIKSIIGIILGIIILIIGAFFTIANSISNANLYLFSYIFSGSDDTVSFDVDSEDVEKMKTDISNLKYSFSVIDESIDSSKELYGVNLDSAWVKSVYYAFYFEDNLTIDYQNVCSFTRCFFTTKWVDDNEVYVIKTNNKELFADIGEMINYEPTQKTIDTALQLYKHAEKLLNK